MDVISEAPRRVPVVEQCDLCVLGGSATGVSAAVTAARMGLKVVIVEQMGFFGGVATAALVNIWHSTKSTDGTVDTIAGSTAEMIDRMRRRNAVTLKNPLAWHGSYVLATDVLKIVLDEMIVEAKVRPFLHARFCAPHVENGKPVAAIIEDKSGRRAIAADYFLDATGDGDFLVRAGLPTRKEAVLQPPTMCAVLRDLHKWAPQHPELCQGDPPMLDINRIIFDPQFPNALRKGFAWHASVPGADDETMLAGTRVFGTDVSDADQLTRAEIEGRRQVACIVDILREHFMAGEGQPLVQLPAHIGQRESRHAVCLHHLTQDELLRGERFPDAIANGTYPVDVHHPDRAGITFRHLDGREIETDGEGGREERRWLPEGQQAATYYQIPYRALVPQGSRNVLAAGRLVDADEGAFGAVRVMVNCNQTGQAAGAAIALAHQAGGGVAEVDPGKLRQVLAAQGAAVL